MIIGTWDKEEIGTVIEGDYRYTETEDIRLFLYIIRVATYEEWVNYRNEQGRPLNRMNSENAHFYEASTD